MTATLMADEAAFENLFPNKSFRIQHKLVGDQRLTLPAILELVKQMPRDRIEYNSGKANVSQDPTTTPLVDLDPQEVVRQIETAGAWMVLKRIEIVPAYKELLETALQSVATAQGFKSLDAAGFTDVQGFLFVSSPGSTTPFHLDSEDNFFVQVHGDKQFAVFDNTDHSIVSEEQIEHAITKHRNIKYEDRFAARGTVNELKPGEGVFVPYIWPHWVKTKDTYSISVAITWKTKEVKRRNDLYVVNSMLRDRGLPQSAPGVKPALDAVKLGAFRVAAGVAAPLRKSEGLRRLIRQVVLGKDANYYYGEKKKSGQVGM
ncbi:cupin-like domain-containing protein [Devosia rhizoryzae]|uniref:Cupin-like domain-containing protein n=1 Tax=Devosia rhizoryzae TaxID=2774137 RepID=A0ABX7C4M8_9HYPH|nr:cupin-like domain-containing protein [Devosia rhizoryzae]QQR39180.1 cupin-like domain-containing protein [Devosia rhizoryzae]